jgi:hypothetical protein
MPWARIPADKLLNLPLFGIDVIADDGDYVWMRGPSGRIRVNKQLPRVFFETTADAHQAGAVSIRIGNQMEQEEYIAFEEHLASIDAQPKENDENIDCEL